MFFYLAKENNCFTWEEIMELYSNPQFDNEISKRKPLIKPEDPTNIQFTSGTTGLPKGAVLSHFAILNNGYMVGKNLNYTPNDKAIIQVPLYHCFGSVLGNLACITNGSSMIYPTANFSAEKSLNAIEEIGATSLLGVPTMFIEILNKLKTMKRKVSTLKKGIMAGTTCPEYLMNRVIHELGITELTICYGMTELAPVTHQTLASDTFLQRTNTVGRNLPHSITKIVDENGVILPRNKEGEVCSISFGRMIGYYEDPKATAECFDEEGFMKTGDTGVIDDEGFLRIVGRKKDIIIRGGENISPKEIEDFLGTHDKIELVQVIAVKDVKLGDEVCAWVKLREGQVLSKEDIASFCDKKLAHFKIPRYIRFVSEFPMTITGKPQKFKMREITNQIIENCSEELKVDLKKK